MEDIDINIDRYIFSYIYGVIGYIKGNSISILMIGTATCIIMTLCDGYDYIHWFY